MCSISTRKGEIVLTTLSIDRGKSTVRVAKWMLPDMKQHYVTHSTQRLTSVSKGNEQGTHRDTSDNSFSTALVQEGVKSCQRTVWRKRIHTLAPRRRNPYRGCVLGRNRREEILPRLQHWSGLSIPLQLSRSNLESSLGSIHDAPASPSSPILTRSYSYHFKIELSVQDARLQASLTDTLITRKEDDMHGIDSTTLR
jgi:hypothetical protein